MEIRTLSTIINFQNNPRIIVNGVKCEGISFRLFDRSNFKIIECYFDFKPYLKNNLDSLLLQYTIIKLFKQLNLEVNSLISINRANNKIVIRFIFNCNDFERVCKLINSFSMSININDEIIKEMEIFLSRKFINDGCKPGMIVVKQFSIPWNISQTSNGRYLINNSYSINVELVNGNCAKIHLNPLYQNNKSLIDKVNLYLILDKCRMKFGNDLNKIQFNSIQQLNELKLEFHKIMAETKLFDEGYKFDRYIPWDGNEEMNGF